jgi:hypothetical protein
MKTKSLLAIALGLMLTMGAYAQKVSLKSGKLDFLKGQKALKVQYEYDGMSVGKFDKEEDYIAKKKSEYNEKEPGKGDKWAESWKADREQRFEPSFEQKLTEELSGKGIKEVGKNVDAPYTMIVKTTRTEPGFNIYVTRKYAEIDGTATIVETANPSKVLAVIEFSRMPGRTFGAYDFDTGLRLSESYEKAAKDLGKFIVKNGLK